MKIVILGATSGMGRSIARIYAARGEEVFLLGFDAADLEGSARDLEARGALGTVGTALCDLRDPASFGPALDAADEALGAFDTVVITAGVFGLQEELEEDIERARELLTVNFAHTVVLCEHVRKRLLARGGGSLCVFSSVAGDRGRKPVAIYGASKAGLSHYLESLDHKHRADGLKTTCVKPGFVRTPMTEGLDAPPFAGEADDVAQRVVQGIDKGTPLLYAPAPWRLIMLVIRHLPRFVMRKIGF